MVRVVLDTNVFIASAYNAGSASRRIVEACRRGELTLVVSPQMRAEYERIVPRAVRKPDELARTEEALSLADVVHPREHPRIVPDDPDDDKFLAAALAGAATALVTNDDHLLALGTWQGIAILRPREFLERIRR